MKCLIGSAWAERPELQHLGDVPVPADPLATVEERRPAREHERHGDQQQERKREKEDEGRERDVERRSSRSTHRLGESRTIAAKRWTNESLGLGCKEPPDIS